MTEEACIMNRERLSMAFDVLEWAVNEVAEGIIGEGCAGESVAIEETVVDGEKGDLFIREVEVDEHGTELLLRDREGKTYYLNSIPSYDQALVLSRMLTKIRKTASSFSREGGAS